VLARTTDLAPPAMIEVLVWLSLLQLLHRLHAYYQC
jgi:hypothetical protein